MVIGNAFWDDSEMNFGRPFEQKDESQAETMKIKSIIICIIIIINIILGAVISCSEKCIDYVFIRHLYIIGWS